MLCFQKINTSASENDNNVHVFLSALSKEVSITYICGLNALLRQAVGDEDQSWQGHDNQDLVSGDLFRHGNFKVKLFCNRMETFYHFFLDCSRDLFSEQNRT